MNTRQQYDAVYSINSRLSQLAAMLDIVAANIGGGTPNGVASDAVYGCAALARSMGDDADKVEEAIRAVAGEPS